MAERITLYVSAAAAAAAIEHQNNGELRSFFPLPLHRQSGILLALFHGEHTEVARIQMAGLIGAVWEG